MRVPCLLLAVALVLSDPVGDPTMHSTALSRQGILIFFFFLTLRTPVEGRASDCTDLFLGGSFLFPSFFLFYSGSFRLFALG